MNKPILTATIVDDEPTARYGIRSYINKTPSLKCVGEFRDIMSLERYLHDNSAPDIIFMDIRMPEVSGLDFIASKTVDSAIIIVTAYEQYAIKGFELNVCDYLLKPVSYGRFQQAIDKTSEYVYFKKGLIEEEYIFLRADRMIHRIRISEIEYAESVENYIKVVTSSKKVITRSTMKEFIEPLTTKGIIQVHKSYAVNVGRIRKVDGNKIVTEEGYGIPLSKTYKNRLSSLLMDLGKNPDMR